MLILEIVRVALGSLRSNPLRSALTMLGVIIGVAAVITMVALGTGAQAAVEERIQSLGSNLLVVRPGVAWWQRSGARVRGARMREEDARAVLEAVGSVRAVVPELERRAQIEYRNRNVDTNVVGTWANWVQVHNWRLEAGRFFSDSEAEGRRRVAVLGAEIAAELFPRGVDPVGSRIRIRGVAFDVVGVLEAKGAGMGPWSQDDRVVVPLSTAQMRLFGTDQISRFTVQVPDEDLITVAMAEMESALRRQRRLRPGVENDFNILSQTQFLEILQESQRTFTLLLAGIAAVSLVVGGIGIMNIMLVSVTERTREIGIRRAIGATRGNIQFQFLVEAVVLSCVGGGLGIGLGWLTSDRLAGWFGWRMLVPGEAVALAFGFAALIGVVFGFYPALRASRLDPIVALRYE